MEATNVARSAFSPGIHILTAADGERLAKDPSGSGQSFGQAIDEMGKRSARAQGLKKPITTWIGFRCSDNRLIVSMGGPTVPHGPPMIRGILRVGSRQLFVRKGPDAPYSQISPLCVLDFYVHESCQRTGDGRRMFDAMLAHEHRQPHQLGYDRPSPKLMAFCAKHYGLRDYIPQSNNFVVFSQYWSGSAAPMGGGGSTDRPLRIGRSSVHRLRYEVAASRGAHDGAQHPEPQRPEQVPPPQQHPEPPSPFAAQQHSFAAQPHWSPPPQPSVPAAPSPPLPEPHSAMPPVPPSDVHIRQPPSDAGAHRGFAAAAVLGAPLSSLGPLTRRDLPAPPPSQPAWAGSVGAHHGALLSCAGGASGAAAGWLQSGRAPIKAPMTLPLPTPLAQLPLSTANMSADARERYQREAAKRIHARPF